MKETKYNFNKKQDDIRYCSSCNDPFKVTAKSHNGLLKWNRWLCLYCLENLEYENKNGELEEKINGRKTKNNKS